ncbi:N-acetyltransferase [Streptomyces sp. ICN441]|uniref:GNAT family N-acetyltransferase n=1 Tax=Streptomyces tirandamycinicus TaxID=2174846 RepID=A0A2S1SV94_9ACTN|nr:MULTISPECIES: GNAT family N-acetyltransferase [Streptomyces]AWI30329.1 GNAT family N-acetyltransferase [Streptomyces tirandamycinicus]TFE49530.1 N-acetyltransferase [Streptomyces sp. ICN441]
MDDTTPVVRIEPWSEGDFELLRALNAPEMTEHLGGPEPEGKLAERHRRYVALSTDRSGAGRMYRVVQTAGGEPVGSIGFWRKSWRGGEVYETGWAILPGFQGRGAATAATLAVVEEARAARGHRHLHAFPSVDNVPSNVVCRKAGFSLMGQCDFEYPPGTPLRSNDWRLDLGGPEAGGDGWDPEQQ